MESAEIENLETEGKTEDGKAELIDLVNKIVRDEEIPSVEISREYSSIAPAAKNVLHTKSFSNSPMADNSSAPEDPSNTKNSLLSKSPSTNSSLIENTPHPKTPITDENSRELSTSPISSRIPSETPSESFVQSALKRPAAASSSSPKRSCIEADNSSAPEDPSNTGIPSETPSESFVQSALKRPAAASSSSPKRSCMEADNSSAPEDPSNTENSLLSKSPSTNSSVIENTPHPKTPITNEDSRELSTSPTSYRMPSETPSESFVQSALKRPAAASSSSPKRSCMEADNSSAPEDPSNTGIPSETPSESFVQSALKRPAAASSSSPKRSCMEADNSSAPEDPSNTENSLLSKSPSTNSSVIENTPHPKTPITNEDSRELSTSPTSYRMPSETPSESFVQSALKRPAAASSSSPKGSCMESPKPTRTIHTYKNFMVLENIPVAISFSSIKKIINESIFPKMFINSQIYVNRYSNQILVVKFLYPKVCKKAVKALNGKVIKGHTLRAKLDVDCLYKTLVWKTFKEEISGSELRETKSTVTPRYVGGEDTYGLSPHLLKSLNIDVITNVIYVRNLSREMSSWKLYEVFKNAGNIVNIYIADKGECNVARIEYDHPMEAIQAISMFHNNVLDERPLIVRMDTSRRKVRPRWMTDLGPGLGLNGIPLRNIRLSEEMKSLNKELNALNSTIEGLKIKLTTQSEVLLSMQRQQKFSCEPKTRSESYQYNNTSNQQIPQNVPQYGNMIHNETGQVYQPQVNQMGPAMHTSGQVNHMSGTMGQIPDQMPQMCAQQGYIGPSNQMTNHGQIIHPHNQIGHIASQMAQGPQTIQAPNQMQWDGQMNPVGQTNGQPTFSTGQTTSQTSISTDQMSQANNQMYGQTVYPTNQMNQMMQLTQMISQTLSQMAGSAGYYPDQLNQVFGQINQISSQMGQTPSQISQTPNQLLLQMGQLIGQMGQMSGQVSQMSQITGQGGPRQVGEITGQVGQFDQTTSAINPITSQIGRGAAAGQIVQMGDSGQMIGQTEHMTVKSSQTNSQIDSAARLTNQPSSSAKTTIKTNSYKSSNTCSSNESSTYRDKHSGSSRSSLSSSKDISRTPSDMLMFSNLPSSVTDTVLINKMKEVGELKFVETTGNGKAIVRFTNVNTATRCMKLFHRSKVDGHTIEVKYF